MKTNDKGDFLEYLDLKRTVSNRLANRHRSIKLKDISKACEVSPSFLSRLEHNKCKNPKVEKLNAILSFLEATHNN